MQLRLDLLLFLVTLFQNKMFRSPLVRLGSCACKAPRFEQRLLAELSVQNATLTARPVIYRDIRHYSDKKAEREELSEDDRSAELITQKYFSVNEEEKNKQSFEAGVAKFHQNPRLFFFKFVL